mgnify:CR=1 FL=1
MTLADGVAAFSAVGVAVENVIVGDVSNDGAAPVPVPVTATDGDDVVVVADATSAAAAAAAAANDDDEDDYDDDDDDDDLPSALRRQRYDIQSLRI